MFYFGVHGVLAKSFPGGAMNDKIKALRMVLDWWQGTKMCFDEKDKEWKELCDGEDSITWAISTLKEQEYLIGSLHNYDGDGANLTNTCLQENKKYEAKIEQLEKELVQEKEFRIFDGYNKVLKDEASYYAKHKNIKKKYEALQTKLNKLPSRDEIEKAKGMYEYHFRTGTREQAECDKAIKSIAAKFSKELQDAIKQYCENK